MTQRTDSSICNLCGAHNEFDLPLDKDRQVQCWKCERPFSPDAFGEPRQGRQPKADPRVFDARRGSNGTDHMYRLTRPKDPEHTAIEMFGREWDAAGGPFLAPGESCRVKISITKVGS